MSVEIECIILYIYTCVCFVYIQKDMLAHCVVKCAIHAIMVLVVLVVV